MEKKKVVMICQPMNGKTDEEIQKVRNEAKAELETQGYIVAESYFKEFGDKRYITDVSSKGVKQYPVFSLAKALAVMSTCDAVYFCRGWLGARGCRIEHSVALEYGLEILED